MDRLRALVGQRAAVRFRAGERDGRPLLSDAVGDVELDGPEVVVRTRRGPVRIAAADVVAARAVPPAVPRRASWAAVARLEELCADAWPATAEQRLGAWRLRAAGGVPARATSALALGDPGVPVVAALDVVRGFAARHGVRPRVTVPVGSRWDRAVTAAGWVLDAGPAAGAEAAVLVAELAGLPRPDGPWTVELPGRPDPGWWSPGPDGDAAGGPPPEGPRRVLDPGGHPRTAFVLARDGSGAPVGRVRAALVDDHLHLSRLDVVPRARRRGLGTALTGAAARWGREHGARFGVLQVARQDTAARALYDATGWTEHHRYRHLVPDGPPRR